MDEVIERLATAWEQFDTPLRMRKGFDEVAFAALKQALRDCSVVWAPDDSIPRLGANILVDIFPATEGNVDLYEGAVAEMVIQAAFELQELVGQCVAIQ